MNIDNNQRYQATEMKSRKAYGELAAQKGGDKITVTDICRVAGIHRTTFYGHYQDIFSLRDAMASMQLTDLILPYLEDETLDFEKITLLQLQFYYRYKTIVKKSLFNFSCSGVFAKREDEYREAIMKAANLKSEAELDYFLAFYDAGFVSVVRKWIMQDCPEPPEVIWAVLKKILK